QHLHAIARARVLAALAFTALSYWLLTTYEVLALRYLRRSIPYTRILFTSFIAYSFGHTLGFAAFTGAAIRFRLYATAGITAIDVATISAFCSLSLAIGLATVGGLSLLFAPAPAARLLHLHPTWSLLAAALLGSLLAYRGVYYLVPLLFGTLLFASKELSAQRSALARAQELAGLYIAPVVPQIAGALTFLAGALLLFSGATPAIDERLAFLHQFLPLAVLEVSHLGASLVGLGLLVLSRALFRRVQAAYHISVWLLLAGMFTSLLKGLDFEEAILLALVLGVLMLGRRAFYRPTAILAERFTPVWVVSILGVIAMAVWIGIVSHRQVGYSDQLWWTFALHGNAPRMLRASLAVIVLGSAYILLNMLRPARPEPAVAGPEELARARALIERSDSTLANAAL